MQGITYDQEADAAYIYFAPISPGQVAETFPLTDALDLDVDETGRVLGTSQRFSVASSSYPNGSTGRPSTPMCCGSAGVSKADIW